MAGLDISPFFRLALPHRIWSGACVEAVPVGYLVPSSDNCVRHLTAATCASDSPLSALRYAQSTTATQAAPLVLRENAQAVVSRTDTSYYCLNNKELQQYLASTTIWRDIITPTDRYLFDYQLPDNLTDCGFDDRTGAYRCEPLEFEPDPPQLSNYTRCAWDDGFTMPPSPALDNNVCEDAVVDVLYNLTWQGDELLLLEAAVLLADVPLQTERIDSVTVTYKDAGGEYRCVGQFPTRKIS